MMLRYAQFGMDYRTHSGILNKTQKYQFKNGFAEQKSSIWCHPKQQNAEISFFVYYRTLWRLPNRALRRHEVP